MRRALVLFTGTGSVDRSLEAVGFQVDNLDMDPKCNATWTCDVLDWEAWRDGTYDFIHSSPPCVQYSIARTRAKTPRNFELADRIVQRTLDIIAHLKPRGWLMENPASGYLRTRDVVAGLPFRDVCYCRYSDGINHKYRKHTRLWGVLPGFVPRPLCSPSSPCDFSKTQAGIRWSHSGSSREPVSNSPSTICIPCLKRSATTWPRPPGPCSPCIWTGASSGSF